MPAASSTYSLRAERRSPAGWITCAEGAEATAQSWAIYRTTTQTIGGRTTRFSRLVARFTDGQAKRDASAAFEALASCKTAPPKPRLGGRFARTGAAIIARGIGRS